MFEQVEKIQKLQNLSLWQKLKFFDNPKYLENIKNKF